MTSTISSFDSATLGTEFTSDSTPLVASAGRIHVHNLRLLDDERSASTPSMSGTTILSSAAPSSLTQSFPDESAINEVIDIPNALPLSLSLNPSMLNSSVLIPSENNNDVQGNWMGLHRTSLSQSSLSSSEISSCDTISHSNPSYAPELFANIGRSLVLATETVSSDNAFGIERGSSDASESESDRDAALPNPSEATGSGKVQWWDQLQTDEDWENFRKKANEYLNALITEEMKDTKSRNERNGWKGSGVNKAPIYKQRAQQQNGFSTLRLWLQVLCETIAAATTAGIISGDHSPKERYFSSLLKEAAEIQQQLERLPPAPPTLPEELTLDDLPRESRELLLHYRDRLDAWSGEAMTERNELTARYVQCQERLLAAIIDSEEERFYRHQERNKLKEQGTAGAGDSKGQCNVLGAVNEDGYIEVLDKKSPLWDDVNEKLVLSQNKCQMTMLSAFVAALTAGAGFFLTLQSKRR